MKKLFQLFALSTGFAFGADLNQCFTSGQVTVCVATEQHAKPSIPGVGGPAEYEGFVSVSTTDPLATQMVVSLALNIGRAGVFTFKQTVPTSTPLGSPAVVQFSMGTSTPLGVASLSVTRLYSQPDDVMVAGKKGMGVVTQ